MRLSIALLAATCGSMLATGVIAVQRIGPAQEPPEPIALEKFGDLPLVTPVQRPHQSALSNVTYSRGPWVSTQANIDQFGNNIPGDAANEPSLAIDPTNRDVIVIGWRQFDTIASDFRQAGYGYSHDRGLSWTFPGVHEPGVFRSDPVLDFDADGNIYYNSLHTNVADLWRCEIFKTADGGVTWSKPMFAFGGDKCWMNIDRTGGIGHGNIYEAWNTAGNVHFPSTFSRSTDGGLSWLEPAELPNRPVFGTVNVGPDGEVYVVGVPNSSFTSTFWVLRSDNAKDPQASPLFDQVVQVDMGGALVLGDPPNPAGLMGQVWVATDHSEGSTRGTAYVLCSVDPSGGDPMDVNFIRSTDGGQDWSSPKRINDDAKDNDAWQWFGTLSVAPNGRIDAVWNDTRNSELDNISELFYAYSTDAGQTWSKNIPVSPAFDSHLGWPNQSKLGDYYDMISDNAQANLAYAATFNGEQDVYFLRLGDCDGNGIHDGEELADGSAFDENGNGVIDVCDPKGACCIGDATCTAYQLDVLCLAAGGLYQGDDSDCDSANCELFGACCAGDGGCTDIQAPADCASAGGIYQDDASDCGTVSCEPFGACCAGDGGCADFQTLDDCTVANGIYGGDESQCGLVECVPFGACCASDGNCADFQSISDCSAADEFYQGDGSECGSVVCEPRGACCVEDICSELVTESECLGPMSGEWAGVLSDCTDADQSGTADVCELPTAACCTPLTGDCDELLPSVCQKQGREPQEPGTTCASVSCPIASGACCLGDGNCLNNQTIMECELAGGSFQGDGIACAAAQCAQPTGACCLENGDCLAERTASACASSEGSYAGDDVTCMAADCQPAPTTGACCLPNFSCELDQTTAECASVTGVYLGDASDCTNCSPFAQACCAPFTGDCQDVLPSTCVTQELEPQGEGTACIAGNCPTAMGACCLGSGECSNNQTESGCGSAGGAYQGDDTDCASVNCPAPQGACCFTTGFCLQRDEADCAGLAGTWQGPATLCQSVNCGISGACCLPEESCVDVNGETCANLDGTYGGDGSECAATNCASTTGACCMPDGSCSDGLGSASCNGAGGLYQGDSTNCSSVSCPAPLGACCFVTGFCLERTEADCAGLAGTWQGAATDCDLINCGVVGACCTAGGECLELTAGACAGRDGDYVGDDTVCNPDPCAAPCPADFDGDGLVRVPDLIFLLGEWGDNPDSPADFDGDGLVRVPDLIFLLGEWGECP